MLGHLLKLGKLPFGVKAAIVFAIFSGVTGAIVTKSKASRGNTTPVVQIESPVKTDKTYFHPTTTQWSTLTVQPVAMEQFHNECRTEGKIAIDEDYVTRIFSPYAGRVTKILVAPGDNVQRGQPLFVVEAADSVQGQNDFIAALTALNKARSRVTLAQVTERRLGGLAKDKVIALKDWQEAQVSLTGAQNDVRSAEITLEAARNRLRLLGKSDAEIDAFQKTGVIAPDAVVYSPLAGTVIQRKVGPGQYVNAGASDSDLVFVIGNISQVWLVAYIRESDAPKVKIGQTIKFTVLSYPDREFEGRIDHVATSMDPTSHRLMVRATIDNSEGLLKPEMFASVRVFTDDGNPTAAVPREAVIYEGDTARVWVVREDQGVELRNLRLGLSSAKTVQVLDGLVPGEKIITRGTLFIDRAALSSHS
jgi:cobalt-zinc-cadmium efflux system membrane fusion protein